MAHSFALALLTTFDLDTPTCVPSGTRAHWMHARTLDTHVHAALLPLPGPPRLATRARPQDARSRVQRTCTCLWVQPTHTFGAPTYAHPRLQHAHSSVQHTRVRQSRVNMRRAFEGLTHARSVRGFNTRAFAFNACAFGFNSRAFSSRVVTFNSHAFAFNARSFEGLTHPWPSFTPCIRYVTVTNTRISLLLTVSALDVLVARMRVPCP